MPQTHKWERGFGALFQAPPKLLVSPLHADLYKKCCNYCECQQSSKFRCTKHSFVYNTVLSNLKTRHVARHCDRPARSRRVQSFNRICRVAPCARPFNTGFLWFIPQITQKGNSIGSAVFARTVPHSSYKLHCTIRFPRWGSEPPSLKWFLGSAEPTTL